jgi:hypothetical protein
VVGRGETGEGPIGRILARLPATRSAWLLLGVRLGLIAALLLELFITAHRQRPDLLDPTAIGTDPSTYYAAGLRLNDGHNLYGPLLPGDRPVPGYPGSLPAPLLSPPLVAVAMRLPAALLGDASMTALWLGCIALIVVFTVWFALRGRPPQLATLAVVLALGLPLTLAAGVPYKYPGLNSPLSFAALSGNLNAYLLGLFVLVWWAASTGHDRVAGVAGALATVLKLGPIVLLWWFVMRRRWQSVIAFVAGLAAFGVVGLVFAGVGASLDYAHLALGGGIQPQGFAVADMLRGLLHVGLTSASGSTYVVVGLGIVAIAALRDRPRAAFAVVIATTIYSSPVVLAGNLALFLAVAAPWAIDRATARPDGVAPRGAMWERLLARAPRSPG